MTPPFHAGTDEAAADVMHSAHSGETTLLRLKPGSSAEEVTHSAHSGETTLLHLKHESSAEEVTHSAHSGETTLPRLKPGSAEEVTHSVHSGETTLLRVNHTVAEHGTKDAHIGPYGLNITRLKDQLKNELPRLAEKILYKTDPSIFESWKKCLMEEHRLMDQRRRHTHLTAFPPAFEDNDDLDMMLFGNHFQQVEQVRHIDNATAVPADLACLQHGFDDLDVKTVHNPFKNVCIQRRSLFKSTAPRFEALKRYWVEKLSLNDKVRNSTHLPTPLPDLADLDVYDNFGFIGPYFSYGELGAFNGLDLTTGYNFSFYENVKVPSRLARRLQETRKTNVEGRKTYGIDQRLKDEVRRHTHPRKAVPSSEYMYSYVDGFKTSDMMPVNNKTLSVTDTISASKLIQPSSYFDMIDSDCLDNKDAVLLKNSTVPNISPKSVNVTKNHDESCRAHELLMRSKTTVAVVLGTLVVTSVIYDCMA
ncbi:Hypp7438 [Branchiostoma lanceolatum]|uniref:Hypp7438 protein n=1 Tax=Branchiostoma lanceolatum TaxID=7740 RepID=A0A8K0E999_BRALA|nr:Hypp7438 [Branchiostoma lanceolatum]